MRRLLVALIVLLTPMLVAPVTASAQDATPEPAAMADTATLTRTDVRHVVPYTEDGLNPSLNVTSTVDGACTFSSSMANGRPDAWACTTDGGVIDPCFENSFVPEERATEVACFSTPWSSDVVIVTLTAPLVREKEAPKGNIVGTADTADEVIQPWDLPWALELANGDRCSLMHGTLLVMAGQTVHYGCEQNGLILGETDHSQPVWSVTYMVPGEAASNQVDVVTAWS